MNAFMIAYDLHVPGQKYECLKRKLEAYGTYWHMQGSVWIIRSHDTAAEVRDNLVDCLDANDKLFVARLSGEAAWWGYSPEGSRWLKESALV